MSYTSTSAVERIGTCSMVGLSGIAFASAMVAAQKSAKSGGRTVVVPNCSAVSASYGHSCLPRETHTDRLAERRDDDPLLAGLHRLRVDHDTVRSGAGPRWFEQEDAR